MDTTQAARNSPRDTRRLMFLFAALYFIQGVSEPTEGLIAQPVRSLLRSWGYDAAGMAAFMGVLAIPWMIKPVYGLLTDFVPLRGSRRRSWLIVWTAATSLALTLLWLFPPQKGEATILLVMLLVPTIGTAFGDVIVDALMVDEGQPRGITGTLQSVGWGAIYGAAICTGWLGGYLSARGMQTTGFVICAAAATGSLLLALFVVKEPDTPRPEGSIRGSVTELWAAAKHPAVLGVGAFLFLWSFAPFGSSVRYIHMTEFLGLGEELYGRMVSVQAVAAVAAAMSYGAICRRVPFRILVHGSVVVGILCTLCWWFLEDASSAMAIAVFYGYTLMIASLVQLDMAARYCPPAVAATVFALLMSLSNAAVTASEVVGGTLYSRWTEASGAAAAYDKLVVVGAVFTCFCWFIVPSLNRLEASAAVPEPPDDG